MTHLIHKIELEVKVLQRIVLPRAKILTVQTLREVPCIWYQRDVKENETQDWEIRTYVTGQPIDNPTQIGDYIGTYQLEHGALVFHVFAKKV